jgi:signal transduction histidine kinase
MLERLRGVVGIAQLADVPRESASIVLVDVGGTSLVDVPKPLAVDELVRLALDLARAGAEMHRRGVMHRDIAPANIVISRDGAPCLVDFALASSVAEVRPDFRHHSEIVGTLAYLAPEQTGRTSRSVDERADLYALGATLYELATGEPPFGSRDPLQLVHDHLARVPVPPRRVASAIPAAVSEIVMHLLEKEPDNRYQTADGLVHDLEQVRETAGGVVEGALRIGSRDFPRRLLPPSRLVGRDAEVATLRAAFGESLEGQCRGVLISGAPGVGKTALADSVRLVVASRAGWFVAGKFDQHRRDLEFDAVQQALRAAGRVLLAEPEHELADLRARILAMVGPNAGLLVATVPELSVLLAVPPDAGDPLTAQGRVAWAALAVLRALASPQRPVVVFLDDLQWAGRTSLGFVDLVLNDQPVDGLLLVGAYRDEVDAAHPLATLAASWREQPGVRHLRLDNLPVASIGEMVGEMLHVDPAAAGRLGEVIEPHTSGNPYETVELLNALRRDGVLKLTVDGWHWNEELTRAHLERSEIAELLTARVGALDPQPRQMVEAMACLGGRAQLSLLQDATGESVTVVDQMLEPMLEDGLLVAESGARDAVRFRHDRIREMILDSLDPQRRHTLQLAMARRLAAAPEHFAVAAEQYLPVIEAIEDRAERRQVGALLRRAADEARLIGDHALVNALLTAALRLLNPMDTAATVEVRTGRHAALFSLGRLEEADEEYRMIVELCRSARDRAEATAVQVRSLSHRTQFGEAIELGLESLRECGINVPAAGGFSAGDLFRDKFERLHRWLDTTAPEDDLARGELTDPVLLAASRLIDAVLPVGYFVADGSMITWLAMEAVRIWIEHGPSRILIGSVAHAAYQAGPHGGDFPAAYRSLRRTVALGEARGYEPGTSQARYMAATITGWFEPIENGVHTAHRAREGLISGGELAYVGYTYLLSVPYSMDCAPSLASFLMEIEGGIAFLRRTGNEQSGRWMDSYRWLVRVLDRESGPAAADAVPLDRYANDPTALIYANICRAIIAAIFGDPAGLSRHSDAAMDLLQAVHGFYAVAQVRLLRGLALAEEARAADGDEREHLLSELDAVSHWLTSWAADAPDNFLHLQRLLEAEQAWAAGDFRAGVLAFDAARREVARRQRPWHRALIAERAGRFHLAHGLEQIGYELLTDARREYLSWGATAKVDQMDWAYPTLRLDADSPAADVSDEPADLAHRRSAFATGTIDLIGVLAASQALSSETSIERLRTRVANVLGAMTGATGVIMVLWSNERQDWLLPTQAGAQGIAAGGAGDDRAAPMSVLRYVQRTREPLVVSDATDDDRFARDPYFAGVASCSLLGVPIVGRGTLQALLVLENRLIRGAFTTERLDVVKLIAGQLAVSLDNAQVYADHRRVADEQAVLRRMATLVAEGPPPTAVFDAVAAEMQQLLDADGVTLARYEPGDAVAVVAHRGFGDRQLQPDARFSHEGESVTAAVRRTARPAQMEFPVAGGGPIAKYLADLGVRSSVGVPIIIEGRLWGIAVVYWARHHSPPADSEARVAEFAKLLETAIANADSRDQLIASRARLLAASDEARRRVVRDLHDGAQQRLVHAMVALRLALRAFEEGDAGAESLVSEALEAVEQGNEELRELSHGILPTVLTRGGLQLAVNTIASRTDVRVDVHIPQERFPAEIEASAYFIVAEALTNVVKYAQATRAEVRVCVEDATLRVEVRDDGIGGADARGHGLVGMSDRVAALRGRLEVDSPSGVGTVVIAMLPLSPT